MIRKISLVQPNFGINKQALGVLKLLKKVKIEDDPLISRHTAPWYNGREKGIVFTINNYKKHKALHIAVFEHRNSDELCALKWEEDIRLNPPTIDSSADLAYKGQDKYYNSHSVAYQQYQAMADWVEENLKEFACSTKTS